jgi:hypothetical protein
MPSRSQKFKPHKPVARAAVPLKPVVKKPIVKPKPKKPMLGQTKDATKPSTDPKEKDTKDTDQQAVQAEADKLKDQACADATVLLNATEVFLATLRGTQLNPDQTAALAYLNQIIDKIKNPKADTTMPEGGKPGPKEYPIGGQSQHQTSAPKEAKY